MTVGHILVQAYFGRDRRGTSDKISSGRACLLLARDSLTSIRHRRMTSTLPSSIYDPPPSFSLVHPGLYRSSVPTSAHFSFLTALHLTSIVSLGPELPSKALQSWASTPRHHGGNTGNASIADHAGTAHATSNGSTTSTGIRFIHLGNQRCILAETRDWRPVQDELIKDALEFILDKRNLPCLVMDQLSLVHSHCWDTPNSYQKWRPLTFASLDLECTRPESWSVAYVDSSAGV